MNCPRCNQECWRDEVHNGVAMLYGPYGCPCGWSEYEEYDQSKITQPTNAHVDQWGNLLRAGDGPIVFPDDDIDILDSWTKEK